MTSFQRLFLSIFAFFLVAYGSPIEQQLGQRGLSALVCAVVTGIIKEVKNDVKVTSHCSSFLKIPTSTVTRTGVTTATVISSATAIVSVTMAPITAFVPQETTVTTTVTSINTCVQPTYGPTTVTGPVDTTTVTEMITSTNCPTPPTTTVIKRDANGYVTVDPLMWAEKRSLEARATKKSGVEILKSLQSKVASTVCGCLSIKTPTVTRTALSTTKTTVWTTVTTSRLLTATTTVPSLVTVTATQTTVSVVPGTTFIPQYTVTVPPDSPPVTETETLTTVSQCTFTLTATMPFLARSTATVHARGDSKGAKPVLFSDKGSAFTLDAEGHLLDENQLVAVAKDVPERKVAAVQFQGLDSARNESMIVCRSGERYLECSVGEQAKHLMVCLPEGSEHPAMYLTEDSDEEDCFEGGFGVEVQEL